MEKVRLNKYLRNAGIGSRRKVEELILEGRVAVNGAIHKDLSTLIGPHDQVTLDGKPLHPIETHVYYLFNKPEGYECTHKAHGNEKIIYDLFPKSPPIFSIGRLDKDTTGLLLLTNDGDFANKVIHPSSNIIKVYEATTAEEIKAVHLQRLKKGAIVEMCEIRPHAVETLRPHLVKISVKEGKKREVRILVKEAGLTLRHLTRTKIGGLDLGDLPLGKYRILTESEMLKIFQ
jgi:23S rRNA pseudouridine2605 synthase